MPQHSGALSAPQTQKGTGDDKRQSQGHQLSCLSCVCTSLGITGGFCISGKEPYVPGANRLKSCFMALGEDDG